ncbi:MarR family winged helix-turn-helix transcriptional regulator [Streptomyces sp. NPDC037389]|uniref:MarR family winged helix-turn-helix transcriptional regulator n=1 Tax=Streptomyces sp. NPDC037389 TaxID=3155369 RepID=UPI0034076835
MTTTQNTQLTTPKADDGNLAGQPIGYWSYATHKAVIRHIRAALATQDVTQPQWWVLNRTVLVEGGLTRQELRESLTVNLDHRPEEIDQALYSLLARGWMTEGTDDRYVLTDAGREAKERIFEVVRRVRAEIHAGITDEEYAAALTVMRRMISNVGADELLSPDRWLPKR